VLLFKNDDWHGGVLYLRGLPTSAIWARKARVASSASGTRFRFTPFQLDLNVTVVKDASGKLLGDWTADHLPHIRQAIRHEQE
jgi:hypothetical protein